MFFFSLTNEQRKAGQQQRHVEEAILYLKKCLNDMKKDIVALKKAAQKQNIPQHEIDKVIEGLLVQFRQQLTADVDNIDVMIGPIMRYLRE